MFVKYDGRSHYLKSPMTDDDFVILKFNIS